VFDLFRSIYDFGFQLLSETSIELSEENKKSDPISYRKQVRIIFVWSEWRDSNSRPPAPQYAQNRIEWLQIALFYVESPSYLFKAILFGFVSFWMNNAQITHKTAVR